MTILTKEARRLTIESAVAGTFIKEKGEKIAAEASAKVRETLMAYLPKDWLASTKAMPPEWFQHKSAESLDKAHAAQAILTGADEAPNGGWRSWAVHFEPFRVPANYQHPVRYYADKSFPDAPLWSDILAPQIAEAKKLRAKEVALRDELTNFLNSCRTYKQVQEKMPELARHLPTVAAKPTPLVVPVAPLKKNLKALGFDRSAP
jgi:hypothetical protein